ncbi:MAG TPA: choice-of-anchor tandem repeat GloVer-containing protein [Rhizomicrobium sp.]|jgi:uncharacterized repeat protein (TIGR03803 family)|nr:choice-of-anchor tandem repeat GloVer-containing protein [Rhizomicrobium sp.]
MRDRSNFRNVILQRVLTIAAATILFALVPLGNATAYTLKTLHNFNETNGNSPFAGVLEDGAGNLYGTAWGGGKYYSGVVFKMVPNGTKYSYRIIKNFCAKANCADGQYPYAGVIMDADGDIWGTTAHGGKYGGGVLFELIPGANGWAWKVVHNFGNGNDGNTPIAGLTYRGQQSNELWGEGFEPAFGTTAYGGKYGRGAVYKLARSGSTWIYTIIHNFDIGAAPQELAMDSAGNLFGTTNGGGTNGGGLMYKLASGTWKETTLHQFCSQNNCADGRGPGGRLWIDNSGNLFGTTTVGGTGSNASCPSGGCGTAFEYMPGGGYEVLYNFCSVIDNGTCADGDNPGAGLVMDSSGALFGTTVSGNPNDPNGGTAFKLVKQGETWQLALIGFPESPYAPLAQDFYNGNLYGTTLKGGPYASGTVFELNP